MVAVSCGVVAMLVVEDDAGFASVDMVMEGRSTQIGESVVFGEGWRKL